MSSGTKEFRMQLWDPRTDVKVGAQRYGQEEVSYGYNKIMHFPLKSLTPGEVVLQYWSEDNLGNMTGD